MVITETAGFQIFEQAFAVARQIGVETPSPSLAGLNSPVTDETDSWVARIWDQVEGAIRTAHRETREAAAPLISRAKALYEEARDRLGRGIETVTAVLLDRLNGFLLSLIDGILKGMRSSLAIGDQVLKISGATVSRNVALSGSFELSLERVLSVSADGQLTIDVEYSAAP